MEMWKSSQKCCKNEKYEPSAFQNRSQNVAATLRSIFMIWWILVNFGKNHNFGEFCEKEYEPYGILKIDLEVPETFWDRFWKAQMPFYRSPTFIFELRYFCNPNGKCEFQHQKPTFFGIYRSGFKRASKIRDFVDAISFSENMDQELFKSGLRMCLRPLVMILWSYQGW